MKKTYKLAIEENSIYNNEVREIKCFSEEDDHEL